VIPGTSSVSGGRLGRRGELAAKRLELLRELVPGAARVAVLVNPASPWTTETTLRDVEAAARSMGLQMEVLKASTSHEIDAAFATLARERSDILFVGGDPFFTSRRVQLAVLAAHYSPGDDFPAVVDPTDKRRSVHPQSRYRGRP
jgi:putative tryptophan/tyrosine transport system substrate-binding protein